jgi:uncharacterized protein YdhG (YjbR/CyaY superfamily)
MSPTARDAEPDGFTAEERAAMKERARELRSTKRSAKGPKTDPLDDLLAKIAELPAQERALAEQVHELVTEAAPELAPRTWYGMPAYARDGKVVCFFQPASKFKARYATLGFNDDARLDDGPIWPTAFALVEITDAVAEQIRGLVRRAVG